MRWAKTMRKKTGLKKGKMKISRCTFFSHNLTLSWRSSLSYRNKSINLHSKSIDWFPYDRDLRHERVNLSTVKLICFQWGNHKVHALIKSYFQAVVKLPVKETFSFYERIAIISWLVRFFFADYLKTEAKSQQYLCLFQKHWIKSVL